MSFKILQPKVLKFLGRSAVAVAKNTINTCFL